MQTCVRKFRLSGKDNVTIIINGTDEYKFDKVIVATSLNLVPQFMDVGWLENGYGQFQLLGQRFGASGKRAWSETGAKAVDSAPFKDEPQIAPDGQGGLFFAWRSPEGAAWDVRAARLDARGRPAW